MQPDASDRRLHPDRRKRTLAAYWHGARHPRRRDGRRPSDQIYPIIDWHSSRVFAAILLILALCVADGVLTVILISHGAIEVNPIMALFVPHELEWFAGIKLLLTSSGMVVLAACSRMRLFRSIPGELLLYAVLAGYCVLVIYEVRLYGHILRANA